MASVTNDSFTSGVFTGRERTRYEYDSKSYRVNLTNEDDVVINEVAQDTWTETSTIEFLADHHNHTGYTQTIRETTTNPDGTTKAIDYTFGHDEIAQRVVERSDPNTITSDATHVFGHDGHGSVRVIYDLATTAVSIAQVFAFAAYGEMIALHGSAANSLSPSSRLSSLGYSGEHFDAKAQQQYLRARFYDPANGRFNRLDPFAGNMQDPLSLHKYAFVHGDPVQGVDPTGEFTMVSSLGGMSIGNAISNPSNDASLSAYSAAIAASSAQSGGEFVQVFNEQFQEALQGSLLSSIPLFGSLYDLYKLGESAFSLIGPTLDLTGEISGGSFGVASGISAAFGLPAVPLRGVRGGLRGWTASRFFTKFRGASTTPWTSVKRTVNGQVDWIPMIGTAQDTSGNHSSIVAGLAKNLAKKADTELVAMNRSLDTVLRTVGGTYPAWARKLGVKIYVPIRFGDSAKTLGAYQPDVVAIQGSTVTIREVASGSQVTSGGAVRQGYLDYLTSVKKEAERLGRRSQLDFRIEVWDSSGNFVREI